LQQVILTLALASAVMAGPARAQPDPAKPGRRIVTALGDAEAPSSLTKGRIGLHEAIELGLTRNLSVLAHQLATRKQELLGAAACRPYAPSLAFSANVGQETSLGYDTLGQDYVRQRGNVRGYS
jgi:hypothetical protein